MAFEGEDARRWSMTDAPTLMPAEDFLTKSTNGPFIDTGIDVKFERRGRIYLSVETIREMAEVAGLLESKNAQEKSLHDLDIYNQGFKEGLAEGADLVGKLSNVLSKLPDSAGDSVIPGVEAAPSLAASGPSESGEPAGDSGDVQAAPARRGKPGGKTGAARSGGGPDDVPGVSDNDAKYRI